MMKPVIYAVEDDAALAELYTYSLEAEFDFTCFENAAAFFDALKGNLPDLILLDIMLPGEDGFSVLARLKEDAILKHIPVIMVSAKGEEPVKVKGLNAGADDYISKPFGVLELIARIKANLRKHAPPAENIAYKDIIINDARREVIINGTPAGTTRKEYKLLSLLCRNAGSVTEREAIFADVWGESFIGETRTLDIHIKQLRKKLAAAGSAAQIKTVRGVGYMII